MEKSKISTQIITGLTVSLSIASAGFHYGWSSPSLLKLQAADSDIPITSSEGSWIVTFLTVGSLCSPFVSHPLVDRFGRKFCLLITVIPGVVSCILIGLAQNFWWFIVARFLAGLSMGTSYTAVPMYLGEIADNRIRGALGTMISLMLNVGILLAYCVGPWVSRVTFAAIGGILPLVFGVIFVWMPESPYYLIMKNKPDRAEKSLLWLRGNGNMREEMERLQESVKFDQENVGSLKELIMVPGNRKAMIIIFGLTLAQQLSGINAVLAYSGLIFEASGSSMDSNISVIILGVVQLLSGVLTIFTVDFFGRRPLLIFSACGSMVFLGGEALYFQLQANGTDITAIWWLPVTAIVGYIVCYSVGLGSLLHVVLSEVFPYNVKALAMVMCIITGAVAGVAVSLLYQVVADAFGIHVSFWGFTVITIFSTVFIYIMLPETKQRSLQDIQDEFHKTTESKTELSKSELA